MDGRATRWCQRDYHEMGSDIRGRTYVTIADGVDNILSQWMILRSVHRGLRIWRWLSVS